MSWFKRKIGPPKDLDAIDAAAWWFTTLKSDPGAQDAFAAWRDADPTHAQAFEQIRAVWDMAPAMASEPAVLAVRAAALSPTKRWGWRAAALAASILLIAGAVTLTDERRPDRGTFTTGVGERSTVTLADGSTMTLDTDSAAAVNYTDQTRQIELTRGRALFEVAKNKDKPFVVSAADQRIVAVGTVFDVRLDKAQVQVTLVEGSVIVNQIDAVPAAMQPGERLVAKRGEPVKVAAANIEQATSWRSGKLVFIDQKLVDAVTEINRYTRTPIVLKGEGLEALSVNGVFRSGQTAEFAQALSDIYPVTATTGAQGITISCGIL